MPQYHPPLRDMQFILHEVLKVTDEFKALPRHADIDAETINAVLEEGGKFASEVTFPLNISGIRSRSASMSSRRAGQRFPSAR